MLIRIINATSRTLLTLWKPLSGPETQIGMLMHSYTGTAETLWTCVETHILYIFLALLTACILTILTINIVVQFFQKRGLQGIFTQDALFKEVTGFEYPGVAMDAEGAMQK